MSFSALVLCAQNSLLLSREKCSNTDIFNANADINKDLFGGVFTINQKYRGAGEEGLTFREEENLLAKYILPLGKNYLIASKSSLYLTDDSKSIGINKTQNLESLLGILHKTDAYELESGLGIKQNSQIGKSAQGGGVYINGSANNISMDEFALAGTLSGEKYFLSDQRDLSGINLDMKAFTNEKDTDNFVINATYMRVYKDFYSPLSSGNILLETRFEKKYSVGLGLNYNLSKAVKFLANAKIDNTDLERAFSSWDSTVVQTKVFRDLSAQGLSIDSKLNITLDNFTATFGLVSESKTEYNTVSPKYDLTSYELSSFQDLEKQRDTKTQINKLFMQTEHSISAKDEISTNISGQVIRYDTPSESNDDDRDEASYIGNISYKRLCNRNLSFKISLDGSLKHSVYLKSSRSAQNKWDRFIRLSESVKLETDRIFYAPEFEVFANYSSYDYEKTISTVQSYSFRQLGYRDTLRVFLNGQYYLELSNNMRYYQRGAFYWATFSESPESYNFENYNKLSLCNKFLLNCFNSLGVRFYSFYRKSAQTLISSVTNYDQNRYSIAPEAKLLYETSDKSNITIDAWYEFSYYNKILQQKTPNFLIQLNYRL